MKSRSFWLGVGFLLVWCGGVRSQEITSMGDINAVSETGAPLFPGLSTMDHYTVEGVVLNRPEIFNGTNTSTGQLSRDYILYIQDATGGLQVYSGQWYGGGLDSYTTPLLNVGDRVRVTGLTGHFGGKTNINERHNALQKFTIEQIGMGEQPTPEVITDVSASQVFDHTRLTGGEKYQGRLVQINNVEIVDGDWEEGGKVIAQDVHGGTIEVELRYGTGIGQHPQPMGRLNIVGIFNQEDPVAPYVDGYLLWPRSIHDFVLIDPPSTNRNWRLYR